jgi:hypothetical protein
MIPRTAFFAHALMALLPGFALSAHGQAAPPVTDPAPAQPEVAAPVAKPLTHRPLRLNAEGIVVEPAAPVPFAGYPGTPPFKVVSRTDKLVIWPCSICHKVLPLNPTPRMLQAPPPHPPALNHGKGRIWCMDCHTLKNRDVLHTVGGAPIDFNESYLLCGQCHFNRQQDWFFGGHGKRDSNWLGDRVLYSCTHCHDPHSPVLKPREPNKLPPVRAGLAPMQGTAEPALRVWERHAAEAREPGK